MSERYKFHDPEGIYFISPTIVDWIAVFIRPDYANMILDSLTYCQKEKGLILHAWVIMPNHLHLIFSSQPGYDLSATMRDFKRHTSLQIIKLAKNIPESRRNWMLERFQKAGEHLKRIHRYKVWQDGNHPMHLDTNHKIETRLNYTHRNPVDAGLVNEPHHYRYTSAIDYAGGKGLLELQQLL